MASSSSNSSRYIDLGIVVRVADVARDTSGAPLRDAAGNPRWKNAEQLLRTAGRWDRRKKRWAPGRAKKILPITFHRGQEAAARWFCAWLKRFLANNWHDIKRVWSILLIGGRRSGKTHLACAALVLFAVLSPRALVWAISPTLETGDELDEAIKSLVPRTWYVRKQAKTGRSTTFRFANGSRILLKSGVKPERLKAGRVDLALLNEAQEQSQRAYVKLRAPIADRGGLVILTANPPDTPAGAWVEAHYNAARAGQIDSEVFELDPRENPLINYAALSSVALEIDQKTYERDVLGLFPPIGDVVFFTWNDRETIRAIPDGWKNVTEEFTKKHLGRAHGKVVGIDFQRSPFMAAAVFEFWVNPAEPDEVIPWIVDGFAIEDADEDDLIDALEDAGYVGTDPKTGDRSMFCACVMDASAWWQDGDHHKGKQSDKKLRARGWTFLHRPQKDSDRNPDVMERIKTTLARLKTATVDGAPGRRRMFSLPTCEQVNNAMRRWENRNGIPNRRSVHAHLCDAVSYVIYRFFGRPKSKRKGEYRSLGKFDRAAELAGL